MISFKYSKILLLFAVSALVMIGACGDSSQQDQEASSEPVRVSINLPLTGPVAAWSGEYPNGLEMGVRDACRELGISPDQFIIDAQDNAGKPATSASVFQQQKLKEFDVYVTGSSESAKAIIGQLDGMNKTTLIAAFDAFMASEHANRLRIMPNSKIEGPLFAEYAKKRNAKTVHIINLDSFYATNEVAEVIMPRLNEAGISATNEQFPFGTKDYKSIALKAKNENADLVFVIGYSFHLYPLLRELRALDMVKDGSVMAALDFVDLLYNDTPVEELRGISFVCPLFDVTDAIEQVAGWREEYKKLYGKDPTYVPAYAYDTGRILVKAFKENNAVTPEAIRAALPFTGLTGTVTLDADGDIQATLTVARVSDQGKSVVIAEGF